MGQYPWMDLPVDQTPQAQARDAQARSATVGTRIKEKEEPYVVPEKEQGLEKTGQQIKYEPLQQSQKLSGDFRNLNTVKEYTDVVTRLAMALETGPTPAGDQILTTLAAKMSDPSTGVLQGEKSSWEQLQSALGQLAGKARKELGVGEGTVMSPALRTQMRKEVLNMVRKYEAAYNRDRKDYEQRAKDYGLNPQHVVGTSPAETFAKTIQTFEDSEKERKGDDETLRAGLLDAPPEDAQLAGQPIKGKRLSEQAEKDLTNYLRSPDATPEGYTDMLTQHALADKFIPPSQEEAFRSANLTTVKDYFAANDPEVRAKINKGLSYEQVDKAAQENAGAGQIIGQALKNVPTSAAQTVEGLAALPLDFAQSAAPVFEGEGFQPTGSTAGLINLGKDVFTDEDTGAADALGASLAERYGHPINTFTTDPVGLGMDVSGVAGLGRSVAGATSRLGRGLGRTATLSNTPELSRLMTQYLGRQGARLANTAPGRAVVEGTQSLMALPSQMGGPALAEGYRAGRTSAPFMGKSPQSEAFTSSMRDPGSATNRIVEQARTGLQALREQASQRYQAGMAQFNQNPQPLDLTRVQQRMQAIRPRNYDAMLDAPHRPPEHLAWERMNNTVEHYAAQAAQDPNLLLPMQMDAFKQNLYDVGTTTGGPYDRSVNRIAREAYNGVRQELIDHDPIYRDVMGDYERAANEVRDIETTFGMQEGRGKPVNVDKAARRLQSVFRNNAYTNYGSRAERAERLAEVDPTGTMMPSLAGQAASSWSPRGIAAGGIGSGLVLGGAFGAPVSLAAVPAAMAASPRVMGELAHGVGRGVAGVRGVADWASDLYGNNLTAGTLIGQTGSRLQEEEIERERKRALMGRYGIELPDNFFGE